MTYHVDDLTGEFDSGSERTLAARLTHASRTGSRALIKLPKFGFKYKLQKDMMVGILILEHVGFMSARLYSGARVNNT